MRKPEDEAGLRKARQLVEHGRGPAGPVRPKKKTIPAPAGAVAPDVYSAADDAELQYEARPHLMPNGKKVWVHPLSPELGPWLNGQAERHLNRLSLPATDPAYRYTFRMLAFVYQAIACCRMGPEPDAPPVWTVDHAEQLYRNPRPGLECMQEIVRKCDELGRATEEALSEEQRGFFGVIEQVLISWSGLVTTASPASLSGALVALGSCFGSIAQRGTFLTRADLAALATVPTPGPDDDAADAEDGEAVDAPE